MSWSANFPEGVRADALEDDLDPGKASASPQLEAMDDHVREQFDAARSAVWDLISKGVAGDTEKTFSVSLSGHANPGHEPTPGSANDCITVSVLQR